MTRGLPLSLLALVACADILGISDYEVTNSGAGAAGASSGPGGSSNGGSAAGAGDTGGSDTGGGSVGGTGGVGPGGAGGNGGAGGSGASEATGGSGGASPCSPTNYIEAVLCDDPLAYLPFDGSLENLGPVGGPAVETTNFTPLYLEDPALLIGSGILLRDLQRLELQDDPQGLLQFTGSQPHTIEAWTQAAYGSSGAFTTIGTWTGTTGWAVFNFIEPVETYEYKRNEAPNILLCDTCAIIESSFNHLVSTYDGTTARTYVNGALARTGDVPILLVGGTAVSLNAANVGDSEIVFNEVAIYDYPLSAAQILLHYQYGKGVVPL